MLDRVVGERDDHALDVEKLHEGGEVVDRSEQADFVEPEPGDRSARIVVDEPDHVDAVLRVFLHFPRKLLADAPGADDDRVLEEARTPTAERTGSDARDGDADDREE